MKALDIDSKNSGRGHWHHFHVDFKTPQRVALPNRPARLEATSIFLSEVQNSADLNQTSIAGEDVKHAYKNLFGEDQMDAYDPPSSTVKFVSR